MKTFEELRHVARRLPSGSMVLVLDTGALIGADETAMIQSLHSRSVGGIDAHLVKLAKKGAAEFMEMYYVGYGDKSIGDCGTTTIFIEGVSMLSAKAIQDSQLYNGQESSTRYVNFSSQPFIDPVGSKASQHILEAWRAFYLHGLDTMVRTLTETYPFDASVSVTEKEWTKAIRARAFDIMRGFLPAGASTNLAWHTTIRHADDHLLRLRHHPLAEVREIAHAVEDVLIEKHPHSFPTRRYEATEAYVEQWMSAMYYFSDAAFSAHAPGDHVTAENRIKLSAEYARLLASRPVKAEPPKSIAECGTATFSFMLDFGSYRDLQRHRALVQRMPLLTDSSGFESWYLDQLTKELRVEARAILAKLREEIDALGLSPAERQYFVPMGYRVTCRITGDLAGLIWMTELRSGISVHPTLRVVAKKIGEMLIEWFGKDGLKLYLDKSIDRFNAKRGTQDIVEQKIEGVQS